MSMATKRNSLAELILSGGRARSHKEVIRALGLHGAMTDLQISECSPVSRSGVCGRVSELLAIDYLEELSPVRCAKTGKNVRRTKLTEKGIFALHKILDQETQAGMLVA
jgi:hypothetical protein